MKRILFLALFSLAGALMLKAQDISGTWSGNIDLGLRKLPVVFHIEKAGGAYTATMDSPDQGAMGKPVTSVTFADGICRIDVSEINFVYTGALQDETHMAGSITQNGRTFLADLERTEFIRNRPQEPQPPFPYSSEEVVFDNAAAGIKLAGTLTYPTGGKKLPAVVMITGSGAQNRDEEIMGHKPFLVIADHFARNGIAVLRVDDRGVGGSGGDIQTATSQDFSTDVYAAVNYLKTRKEINSKKIGLAGHSEGGLIAFITAAAHPKDIAFVISMAGPGVRGDSISIMQVEDLVRQQGLPEPLVQMSAAKQRETLEFLYGNTQEFIDEYTDDVAARMVPGFAFLDESAKNTVRAQIKDSNSNWSRFFISHDPAADIRATHCPVLAINGDKDLQVRSSVNLEAIRQSLQAGGNTNFKITEYPGLNHLFQTAVRGTLQEYGDIEETISPKVLEDTAAWIISVTK